MLLPQISLLLLLLALALGVITPRSLSFPYWLVCGLTGCILGLLLPGFLAPAFLTLLLPPIVFGAAFTLTTTLLWRNFLPIAIWAIVSFLLTLIGTGWALTTLTSWHWQEGLLLGAIVATTSLTANQFLLQQEPLSQHWQTWLKTESLINNVLMVLVIYWLITGQWESNPSNILSHFLTRNPALIGSLGIGWVSGLIINYSLQQSRTKPLFCHLFCLFAAYGVFFSVERILPQTGVLAVATAGLTANTLLSSQIAPSLTQKYQQFWQHFLLIADGLLFFSVGLTLTKINFPPAPLSFLALVTGVTVAIVFCSRAVTVFVLIPLANLVGDGTTLNRPWQLLLFGFNTRSSLGLLLILILNLKQEVFLVITLSIIVLTLLISWSTSLLMNYHNLVYPKIVQKIIKIEADLLQQKNNLNTCQQLKELGQIDDVVYGGLRQQHQDLIYQLEQALGQSWAGAQKNKKSFPICLWWYALNLEESQYQKLYQDGILSAVAWQKLHLRMTLRREAVRREIVPPPFFSIIFKVARSRLTVLKILEKIKLKPGAVEEYKQDQGRLKYEIDLAITYTGDRVSQHLLYLLENQHLESPLIREWAQIYQDDSLIARRNLEKIAIEQARFYQNLIARRSFVPTKD